MKRQLDDYLHTDFYAGDDTVIDCYSAKMVVCRKPHECMGGDDSCKQTIRPGEYALCERGFIDGKPVSFYTCTNCMDAWLDIVDPLDTAAEMES